MPQNTNQSAIARTSRPTETNAPTQLNYSQQSRSQFEQPARSNNARSSRSPTSSETDRRNRNTTATIAETTCAWCTENGQNHNHVTAQCSFLQQANVQDQWRVLQKHKICKNCLLEPHDFWQCTERQKRNRCQKCRYTHNEKIGCCPPEFNKIAGDRNTTSRLPTVFMTSR